MADPEKKVEVRFGAFSCSIEGYDNPVEQMREIIGMMQKMISETPALAETPGAVQPELLTEALDGEGAGTGPGVVIIRNEDRDGSGGAEPIADDADEIVRAPEDEPEAEAEEDSPDGMAAGGAAILAAAGAAGAAFMASSEPAPAEEEAERDVEDVAEEPEDDTPAMAEPAPRDTEEEPAEERRPWTEPSVSVSLLSDTEPSDDYADGDEDDWESDAPAEETAVDPVPETEAIVEEPAQVEEVTETTTAVAEPEPVEEEEPQPARREERRGVFGFFTRRAAREAAKEEPAQETTTASGTRDEPEDPPPAAEEETVAGDSPSEHWEPAADTVEETAEESGTATAFEEQQPADPEERAEEAAAEPEEEAPAYTAFVAAQVLSREDTPEAPPAEAEEEPRAEIAPPPAPEEPEPAPAPAEAHPVNIFAPAPEAAEEPAQPPGEHAVVADNIPPSTSVNIFAPPATDEPPRGDAPEQAEPEPSAAPEEVAEDVAVAPAPDPVADAPRSTAPNIFAPPVAEDPPETVAEAAPPDPAPESPQDPATVHSIFGEQAAETLVADSPEDDTAAEAPADPPAGGNFSDLLHRVHGAGVMGAPGEVSDGPDPAAIASQMAGEGLDAATLAGRAGDPSTAGLLAASAAWLTLAQGRSSFSRREVMDVLATIPADEPRDLADRIKGFGRLVRSGRLVLVGDGAFAMAQPDRERFEGLISRS